jgi:hypothetical protein
MACPPRNPLNCLQDTVLTPAQIDSHRQQRRAAQARMQLLPTPIPMAEFNQLMQEWQPQPILSSHLEAALNEESLGMLRALSKRYYENHLKKKNAPIVLDMGEL